MRRLYSGPGLVRCKELPIGAYPPFGTNLNSFFRRKIDMRSMLENRIRLGVVYCLALAVSLPIALINLSKLACLATALLLLLVSPPDRRVLAFHRLGAMRLIGAAFLLFWLSAAWSTGTEAEIVKSVAQHGNLLAIPVLYFLVRSRDEAATALRVYFAGQLFLVLSSYALFLDIALPWMLAAPDGNHAVFSSYLDQSVMTGVFAAISWHLREILPQRGRLVSAVLIVGIALGAVFFLFIGRTGHLLALGMLTLAVLWAMPERLRPAVVLFPLLVSVLAFQFSPQFHDRFLSANSEIQAAIERGNVINDPSSTGLRISYWVSSIQAIEAQPWIGHGAGSWNSQYNSIQRRISGDAFVETSANAHQEFLFWGVELGLPGIALLLAILFSFYRLSQRMDKPARQATQSVVAAIVIASLFNCALYDALIGDYLCVALALVLCYGLHPRQAALVAQGEPSVSR